MKNMWPPQDQVFWYLNRGAIMPCREDIYADVAIIGGGMAGLSAAQAFHARGKKVVLLEQYYCGSGATGKSSGFITPNAELSFTDFSKRYNSDVANTIWDFITSGVNDIRTNIEKHHFACDYAPQDTLVVATSKRGLKELEIENTNLSKFGYKSAFYTANQVRNYIGSKEYYGGFGYEDTFGIKAYAYCQELKKYLQAQGVLIFEETPVTALNNHALTTAHATITADYVIVCTDHFMPELGLLKQDVYHAQTFLMASQQLTPEQVLTIFPNNNRMVWDTDLVYNYFRITGDNRLLLGGGSVYTTYSSKEDHSYTPMLNKLTKYFKKKFPTLNIQFEQMWPGLIGLSKDIAPIAGSDKDNPYIYYISAAAGLPIAAALGKYSAEHLIDGKKDLDEYFSPYRKFPIGGIVQSVLGTKLSFALCNFLKKNVP
jgi:gamma-glutamylputrescine oxidase